MAGYIGLFSGLVNTSGIDSFGNNAFHESSHMGPFRLVDDTKRTMRGYPTTYQFTSYCYSLTAH
jgi:hypothetical protein